MTWPVPSGRGSCGNAIVPDGPAFVYRPAISSSDTGSRGKSRRMRDDGKIIFTPLPHKDRSRFRNLMTVHLQENPFRYRIGKVLTRFSDEQLPEIEQMLRTLLVERG